MSLDSSHLIFNIIGPWLLVLGAFVYETNDDMNKLPNDWRHRLWPRHVLLWGVRGNGKACLISASDPEIPFRGYH